MKPTALQIKTLRAIITSEFRTGFLPVGDAVWSDCITTQVPDYTPSQVAGCLSSLVKKGWVETQQESRPGERDGVVWVTQEGYEMYLSAVSVKDRRNYPMLRIEINTDNAAFEGQKKYVELAFLLGNIAAYVMEGSYDPEGSWQNVRDINGNTVGRFSLKENA